MRRIIFAKRDGGQVVLSENALSVLTRYVQTDSTATEAGGVILGRLILNSNDVVVDEATEPSISDRRSRFFFWRSKKTTQGMVNKAWNDTHQTRVYLGEWHSHPEDDPTPSCIDKRNWRKIVRRAKFEQDFLLFLIVGRKEIRLWELRKTESEPTLLVTSN